MSSDGKKDEAEKILYNHAYYYIVNTQFAKNKNRKLKNSSKKIPICKRKYYDRSEKY
jgi:hypothetical protein